LPSFGAESFVFQFAIHNYRDRDIIELILLVVLYGCEVWSLTLREERGQRVFENRVLRRIFGPRRDEVIEEWRRLHHEKLYDLHSVPSIYYSGHPIGKNEMGGACGRYGGEQRCIQGFGGEI